MEKLCKSVIRIMAAALLFASFATGAIAQAPASDPDAAATQSVIADQLDAFQSGDNARAYSHAAPSIQQMFPDVASFMRMVNGGYSVLIQPEFHTFGRNVEINGSIHQEVIVTDKAGKLWQAVYTLRQQADGSWKITGVKLNPYKGASA